MKMKGLNVATHIVVSWKHMQRCISYPRLYLEYPIPDIGQNLFGYPGIEPVGTGQARNNMSITARIEIID
jgi:hypothetical protein